MLQIDDFLDREEPAVPRLKRKKNAKSRTRSGTKSQKDLFYHWIYHNQGKLSLKHGVPIPQEGVHTVRAIPSILNILLDDERPSLRKLCQWTNQFYNQVNFNIRLCIDSDILQIFNALHLSGLLKHSNMNEDDDITIGSGDNKVSEGVTNEEEGSPHDSASSGSESNEESSSSGSSSENTQ